ncbi:MAG: cupin domain-containing protein [Candidatus Omnitrophota bacterium]
MDSIKVEKPDKAKLDKMKIFSWPIWEKDASRFNWHYDEIEECYFLEGSVTVETKGGEKVSFGKGDFVTFPKGLSCTWDIKEPVRKHYNFR